MLAAAKRGSGGRPIGAKHGLHETLVRMWRSADAWWMQMSGVEKLRPSQPYDGS
jgi:hypothetical protein